MLCIPQEASGQHAGLFRQSCSTPNFPSVQRAPIDEISCPAEGRGGAEAAQNVEKNNFCATDPPHTITIQYLVTLQKRAERSDVPFGQRSDHPLTDTPGPATDRSTLESLGEGSEVVLIGYIKIARQEGPESVNCGKGGVVPNEAAYHDIHISIVDDSDDAECSGIVAEMIPHHRPDSWTPELVNEVAKSRLQVRITGNLMFDSSHTPCVNGKPLHGDPARASLWEVHPIYRFEVCTTSDCSSGRGWVPLESWRSQQQ